MERSAQTRILFTDTALYTPRGVIQPGWLLVEDGVIRALGAGTPPQFEPAAQPRVVAAGGRALLPGFIDLHVHGALGHEVMDASPDALAEMARFYAAHGVTAFLATTWTAARGDILAALAAVETAMHRPSGGAQILGAHLEGPYLNPDRCGAQDERLIRRAEPGEALEFLETGIVRQVALAPEFAENLWLTDECVRRGITVAAGHTAATFEEMQTAVQHGVRQVTHCFNAMTGLNHRQPGTVGAALALPELGCELIADTIHVHPAVMRILAAAKSPQGVLLITDAIRGVGLPDGEVKIDTRVVTIKNGEARLPDGHLAGSVLTLERGLRNLMAASGWTLEQAWPTSSLNAARSAGVAHRKGSLEVGKDADLVLLGADWRVNLTLVGGEVVYNLI